MKKKSLIFLGLVFFLLFLLFSRLVGKGSLTQFDFDLMVKLQNHLPKKFDAFLSFLSPLGSLEITTFLLIVILLLRRKLRAGLVFLFYILSLLLELIGKSFLYHPGPPFFFLRSNLGFLFPSSYIETSYSYPSGHALRASFLTVILLTLIIKSGFKKIAKYGLSFLLVIIFILMLVSRVSLGEHWPSDVIAGSFLGLSFAFLAISFW